MTQSSIRKIIQIAVTVGGIYGLDNSGTLWFKSGSAWVKVLDSKLPKE